MVTSAALEESVRKDICSVCAERDSEGNCGLATASSCALFHYFPQVMEAIRATHSDDAEAYTAAIRDRVCAVCREQGADGECDVRQEGRCALDAYLLLVIAAIGDDIAETIAA